MDLILPAVDLIQQPLQVDHATRSRGRYNEFHSSQFTVRRSPVIASQNSKNTRETSHVSVSRSCPTGTCEPCTPSPATSPSQPLPPSVNTPNPSLLFHCSFTT